MAPVPVPVEMGLWELGPVELVEDPVISWRTGGSAFGFGLWVLRFEAAAPVLSGGCDFWMPLRRAEVSRYCRIQPRPKTP